MNYDKSSQSNASADAQDCAPRYRKHFAIRFDVYLHGGDYFSINAVNRRRP